MRTCPAPGCGTSRSTISKSPPALRTCATFIGAIATLVVAMLTSGWNRSEEHTSELQSRGHLVCRLLLEKKKYTPTSRYAGLPTTKLALPGGREAIYVTRRFVPGPERFATLKE